MPFPIPRLLSLGLLLAASSCQLLPTKLQPLPQRDESFSYLGPGSERVLKGSVPPFSFAEDSSQLLPETTANGDALEKLLDKLGENPERQIILAGFANDSGTAEFNRVLGEERAQAVRQAVLAKGIAARRLHTVSYGNELDSRQGSEGRRVEVGLVDE